MVGNKVRLIKVRLIMGLHHIIAPNMTDVMLGCFYTTKLGCLALIIAGTRFQLR